MTDHSERSNRTASNLKEQIKDIWETQGIPVLQMVGIMLVILSLAMPFLLDKPLALIMLPLTVVGWASVWMTSKTIKRHKEKPQRKWVGVCVTYTIFIFGILALYYTL